MAKINKKKLTMTFKNIWNESQMEQVLNPADEAGCTHESLDFGTKIIVKAKDEEQMKKFIKLYNA